MSTCIYTISAQAHSARAGAMQTLAHTRLVRCTQMRTEKSRLWVRVVDLRPSLPVSHTYDRLASLSCLFPSSFLFLFFFLLSFYASSF